MNHPVMINGKNYDWADLAWVQFGVPLTGISEIEYFRKRDAPNNYGGGSEPVSFGYKNFEYVGSITVMVDELRAWVKTAPNGSILEIPPFTATNVFSGDMVMYNTDRLRNIRFIEDPFTAKQNDSVLYVKVPFVFAGLIKS